MSAAERGTSLCGYAARMIDHDFGGKRGEVHADEHRFGFLKFNQRVGPSIVSPTGLRPRIALIGHARDIPETANLKSNNSSLWRIPLEFKRCTNAGALSRD